MPSRDADAARAAKPDPWLSARETDSGPDVSGRPATTPPTAWPKRRESAVASATSAGTAKSTTTVLQH